MKSFLVMIALVFAASVSAKGFTPIDKKDVSLSEAKGTIISAEEVCPKVPGRPSCMAYGSTVTVKISLGGCLDRFGGHFSNFEIVDGRGILYFGAINIFNSASRTARCVAPPTETVRISVPFEGDIELVNLNFRGTVLPQY